ncbi:MAG: opacity protein-like surface antigen [Myxococcota bacterium]|jgi:opacity protein-like surface antigen
MKKYLLVLLLTLVAFNTASAQDSDGISLEDFSAQAGLGFFANDDFDGFMLNFGGAYHVDENWSAGVDLQLGFEDDFLLLSMPFYGQYDFNNFSTDVDILKDMHVFAKLGMGFTYTEFDPPGPGSIDDTGFLFVLGGGVSYELNEHIALESRMQFNITTNEFYRDDFYFSWEVLAARYRF